MKKLLAILTVLSVSQAVVQAYPDMIRHRYTDCTTCHVSPSGGGLLTEYGRGLSKEVLSGKALFGEIKEEETFIYGLVKTPKSLLLGGDYRAIYVYTDTARARDGQWIQMQADLEGALLINKWTLSASLGFTDEEFGSRNHYLMYTFSDESPVIQLRAGKFKPTYGLNVPDHSLFIRKGLNLNDEDMETYNLEFSHVTDLYSVFLTAIAGKPADDGVHFDQGLSAVGSVNLWDSYRVGWSYYHGNNSTRTRDLTGPFVALGFSKAWVLEAELDFQKVEAKKGLAQMARLSWEFEQGYHLYGQEQFARYDFRSASEASRAYSVGIQAFPRPHIALDLQWSEKKNLATSPDYYDSAYFLIHYYL